SELLNQVMGLDGELTAGSHRRRLLPIVKRSITGE
ncbi:MAG: hypothetical protein RJB01_1844, partial [Actinomycetota bacterium]